MTKDEIIRRGGLDFVLPIIQMGSFLDIMDFGTFKIVLHTHPVRNNVKMICDFFFRILK